MRSYVYCSILHWLKCLKLWNFVLFDHSRRSWEVHEATARQNLVKLSKKIPFFFKLLSYKFSIYILHRPSKTLSIPFSCLTCISLLSIVVIKTLTKSNMGEKGLFGLKITGIIEGSQVELRQNTSLEEKADAEAIRKTVYYLASRFYSACFLTPSGITCLPRCNTRHSGMDSPTLIKKSRKWPQHGLSTCHPIERFSQLRFFIPSYSSFYQIDRSNTKINKHTFLMFWIFWSNRMPVHAPIFMWQCFQFLLTKG